MSYKPMLTGEQKILLKKKNEVNRKRVEFHRQEWFRYKKFDDSWRRPRGKHSKLRSHLGYRPPVVSPGFRTPRAVRGLHPSGFKEVLIHNVAELAKINPDFDGARIASTVGYKKRLDIQAEADNLGIHIFNRVVR
ncbi:MAG: 50S ribosomal protein L32e [Ferroplasma sp.]